MVEIPRTEDFVAQAAEGCVLLDGPGTVCSLHPDVALHVADLLIAAAAEAVGQRKVAEMARGLKPV
jgi:hypothetical protein